MVTLRAKSWGSLCHVCVKASLLKLTQMCKKTDSAFIKDGFKNWKKGIEKFKIHESSEGHLLALSFSASYNNENILAKLDKAFEKEQVIAQNGLLKIISSLKYLVRNGLAIREHTADDGNFD